MCKSIMDALCYGATTDDALRQAKRDHGDDDGVDFGLFGKHAQVRLDGEANLTLKKLYNRMPQQNSMTTNTTQMPTTIKIDPTTKATTQPTTKLTTKPTTKATTKPGNTKTAPTMAQIEAALKAKQYCLIREDVEASDIADNAIHAYRYEGFRFFDENGIVEAPDVWYEEVWDDYDDCGFEYVMLAYVQFTSVKSAQKTFQMVKNDYDDKELKYASGDNWERLWMISSEETEDLLICRIDDMLFMMGSDWDDFDDADLSYDHAAFKAMEQLGF